MTPPASGAARLSELMARRTIEGLSVTEQQEFDTLLVQFPAVDPDELDRAAAALVLCSLKIEPMPAGLRNRIEADARAFFAADRD